MFSTSKHNPCSTFVLCVWFLLCEYLTAFQITGAQGGISADGERPLRRSIDEFASSGPAFHLFILALKEFQAVDQSDPLSYFQVAGIHGYPRVPWDNVAGSGNLPGFCIHAATPFPTWHRPYMALYEQLLWQHAQDIASTYPYDQRDQYMQAALTLRHPYWDWAVHPALPDVVTHPQIEINTATGWQTIENPLYQYNFQTDAAGDGIPFSNDFARCTSTVRHWDPTRGLSNSDQSAANAVLLANAPTIQTRTYQLFTSVTNYTTFSCTSPGGQLSTGNNIEDIHNSIHAEIGGFGHMADPGVASFDPIFWLHHANVDRLFAMWQAVYPDSYIEPTANDQGSYYEPYGVIDSGSTRLAPFHSDNGSTMFTSDDVRSTKTFGYSYPELPDWRMNSDELAASVQVAVNSLYGPNNNSTVRRSSETIRARSTNFAESFGHVSLDLARQLNVNNRERQWGITVLVDRFSLDTNFCIDFFMGDAPADIAAWPAAANLIGTYAQFIPANVTALHPDGFLQGQVHGEISMTHTLAAGISRGVLQDLLPRSVVPLLQKALTWKVRTPAGEEVPITALTGLSISVSTRVVVPRSSRDRFPRYGAVQWVDAATEGKPCGAGQRHK